jgi:hypothetical protein
MTRPDQPIAYSSNLSGPVKESVGTKTIVAKMETKIRSELPLLTAVALFLTSVSKHQVNYEDRDRERNGNRQGRESYQLLEFG